MKHIAILAPVHPYNDIRVFRKEARSLAAAGHKVDLLARAEGDFIEDGVNIIGLPRYEKRLQRFLALFSLMFTALKLKADVYHLHNPDTIPVGLFLKLFGKKVVYDTHENFRDLILYRTWIPKGLRQIMSTAVFVMEKLAAIVFNKMVVTQKRQLAIFGKKCVLIENPPITDDPIIKDAKALSANIEKDPSTLYLVYPGLISAERGAFQIVSCLNKLNQTTKAELWLMGVAGDDQIINDLKKLPGWNYVNYLGQRSQVEAFSYMAAADIGLIVFLEQADNPYINPNKIFEYQVFGTPFIASNFPTWRSYMDENESGLWIDPESEEELLNSISQLAKDTSLRDTLGTAGQRFTREQYNWENESKKLISLYDKL